MMTPNWFLTIKANIINIELTLDFCFNNKTQVTLVQLSIKVKNHFALEILETLVEAHVVWIREKGKWLILLLTRKSTCLFLANSQTSYCRLPTSKFLNKEGNITFTAWNEMSLRKWWSWIFFFVGHGRFKYNRVAFD